MGVTSQSSAHRCVLVGCGGMADVWLGILKGYAQVEIAGLCDVDTKATERRKAEYELADAATGDDLAAMLDAARPDVVIDLTPPEFHYPTTMAALARGCHVFSEKPLADSMAHALEMRVAARQAGRMHAVMQNRRFDPHLDRFCEVLRGGAMGALTTLNADFYVSPHFGGFREQMRHVLLLDMAIHHFDAARAISGADPVSVYCHEWNPAGSWYAHGASAMAVFEMSDGSVFNYRGSWCANGLPTTWECAWRGVCEGGSAAWDGGEAIQGEVATALDGMNTVCAAVAIPPVREGAVGGHPACIDSFIRALDSGEAPPTSIEDNMMSLAMVMGAIESAKQGRRILIDELLNGGRNT